MTRYLMCVGAETSLILQVSPWNHGIHSYRPQTLLREGSVHGSAWGLLAPEGQTLVGAAALRLAIPSAAPTAALLI